MSKDSQVKENSPIDAVVTWVDGDDPRHKEKMISYFNETDRKKIPGAHPTRFASINEIKYCVLSILTFAPFIRNIYIITDDQDPNIFEDIKAHFPERLDSVKIVDHKEIFRGYEEYLPTFSCRSIESMMWRIKGLSNNFVYFNDDLFLIRKVRPGDWFINDRPVLRGKWQPFPFPRIIWYNFNRFVRKHILRDHDYQPKPSFHMGQWNSASMLGFKFRYFVFQHTPHPISRKTAEEFFNKNKELFKKTLVNRFKEYDQFNFSSLIAHLELIDGNRYIKSTDLAYLQPHKKSNDYIDKKIDLCKKNPNIKFLCVQSLDRCTKENQDKVFSWLKEILNLPEDA